LYSSASHAAARASLETEITVLKAQAPAGYFPQRFARPSAVPAFTAGAALGADDPIPRECETG
jgi:hypothetical protein